MRIFDFTLMNGYEFSGVDVAQGFRARLFKKNNIDIKFIFMNLPTQRDLDLYINQGIDRDQIISKEIYLTGRMDMRLSTKKDILISKEIIAHDDIIEKDNITYLIENNKKKCEIICDDENNIMSASYSKMNVLFLLVFILIVWHTRNYMDHQITKLEKASLRGVCSGTLMGNLYLSRYLKLIKSSMCLAMDR